MSNKNRVMGYGFLIIGKTFQREWREKANRANLLVESAKFAPFAQSALQVCHTLPNLSSNNEKANR
ncbi:MAG: hypothetical protein AB1509_16940 [Chloroflexota bacterium]